MKTINYLRVAAFSLAVLIFVSAGFAQDTKPVEPQDGQNQGANQQPDIRTNALRQLGLSREQVQQIRRMNMERKPLMDEAQNRLRMANRSLDDAIYADQVNDADVQARLKELQLAQADVARIRFMNELSVRKILTPEQLVRFREIRQRFEQVRENIEKRNVVRKDANRSGDAFAPRQTRPVIRPNIQKPQ
ncbi:MAG: hypothetical protein KA831_01775 [Pyrinomonadaceae bacterium]|nr:hypothetical protein [Pyrinomonadaceae bacterium]